MATNLKALQDRLNSNEAFRARFLKSPVKTFEAEGVVLPAKAKKDLSALVKKLKKKVRPVSGSTLDVGNFGVRIWIQFP
jgi:hypothetical protein